VERASDAINYYIWCCTLYLTLMLKIPNFVLTNITVGRKMSTIRACKRGGATRLYIYHSTSHTSVSCRCSTVTHVPSMQAIPYLPTRAAQAGGGNFKLQTSVVPTSSHNSHSESNGLCRFTVATPPNLLKPIKSTATANTLSHSDKSTILEQVVTSNILKKKVDPLFKDNTSGSQLPSKRGRLQGYQRDIFTY
jgi:hypothetical protein